MLHDNEIKINSKEQVRWNCRRGMLELDKLLLPFFDDNFDGMSNTGKQLFIKFLESSDQELFDWLFKSITPEDSRLHDLVLLIRYVAKKENCEALELV